MTTNPLAVALEREHAEVDAGLEEFAAGLASGDLRAEPLHAAATALRRHIYLEEEMLFPSLSQTGAVAAVFVMLREHGDIWRSLDELEAQVAQSGTSDEMRDVAQRLAAQLEAHNLKEERVLYPQADTMLAPEVREKLATFLESGRMPEGWVCARARV